MPFPRTPEEAQQLINEFHQAYSEHTGTEFRVPSEAVAHALDSQNLSDEQKNAVHAIARMAGLEPHLQLLRLRPKTERERQQYLERIGSPHEPVYDYPLLPPWVKQIQTPEDMQRALTQAAWGAVSGAAIGTGAALGGPVVAGLLAAPLVYTGLKGLYGTLKTGLTEGPEPAWKQAETGVADFIKGMVETPYVTGQTLGGLAMGPVGTKYARGVPILGRMYKPRVFDVFGKMRPTAVRVTKHAEEVPSVIQLMKERYNLAFGGGKSKQPGTTKAPLENLGIRLTVDAGRQMERVPVIIERPSPAGGTTQEKIEAVRFGDRYFNIEGKPIEEIGRVVEVVGEGQSLLQTPKDLVLANEIARRTTGETIGRIRRGFIGHQPVNKERLIEVLVDKVEDLSKEAAEELYNNLRGDAKQIRIKDLIDEAAWMNRLMKARTKGISNPNELWRQRMIMAEFLDKKLPQLKAAFREVVKERVERFDPEAAKAWTNYAALSEVQKVRPKEGVPLGEELHLPGLAESLWERFKNFRLGRKFETKLYGQLMSKAEKTMLREDVLARRHVRKLKTLAEEYPEAGDQTTELKPRTINIEPLVKAFISASPTTARHVGIIGTAERWANVNQKE